MERLETADLVIRPPCRRTRPRRSSCSNDPDVRRWNPTRECPTWRPPRQWCRDGADWSDGSPRDLARRPRDTGRMVGNVSLFAIDADDLVAKIGYRVLPAARGRGVARQMVMRSLAGRSTSAG